MVKKPAKKLVNCENCRYSDGEPHPDPENKDITRIYCKARYAQVDMENMSKFCDFFDIKPEK